MSIPVSNLLMPNSKKTQTRSGSRRESIRKVEFDEQDFPGQNPNDWESGNKPRGEKPTPTSLKLISGLNWAGCILVTIIVSIAPWMYGSVSQSSQFYLAVGLAISLGFWWAVISISKPENGSGSNQASNFRLPTLAIPVIFGVGYLMFQLTPLPESLANIVASKQTELYANYSTAVEGEIVPFAEYTNPEAATRITMDPNGTRRMLNLLIVSLVGLLASSQFLRFRYQCGFFMVATTINAVVIGGFGLAQRASFRSSNSVYGIVSFDAIPFGPFVNANNAAGYLLIGLACSLAVLTYVFVGDPAFSRRLGSHKDPALKFLDQVSMAARYFFAELNATRLASILSVALIASAILATGSRGAFLGLISGLGLAATVFSLAKRSVAPFVGVAALAVVICAALFFVGSGERIEKEIATLSEANLLDKDTRLKHWSENAGLILQYAPFGSGVGSYLYAHRRTSSGSVFEHAENQYFQTLIEAGIPGFLLLATSIGLLILIVRLHTKRKNRNMPLLMLGCFLVPSQLVSALFDFGLNIPANALLLAVICGLLAGRTIRTIPTVKHSLSIVNLNRAGTLMLLTLLFAAVCSASFSSYRQSVIESAIGRPDLIEDFQTLSSIEVTEQLADLEPLVSDSADYRLFNRLANLRMHNFRLELMEGIVSAIPDLERAQPSKLVKKRLDSIWASTDLVFLGSLQQQGKNLFDETLVKENLLPAIFYLQQSRRLCPLQPQIHLLLAQLQKVSNTDETEETHLHRCLELSPNSPGHLFRAGLLDLESGRESSAKERLKRCLEISPHLYPQVFNAVGNRIPNKAIANEILPNDPTVLFQFASQQLNSNSEDRLRVELLRRANQLLEKRPQLGPKQLVLSIRIAQALKDFPRVIEQGKQLLRMDPNDSKVMFQIADALIETKSYEEAAMVARDLLKYQPNDQVRLKLLERINQLQAELQNAN